MSEASRELVQVPSCRLNFDAAVPNARHVESCRYSSPPPTKAGTGWAEEESRAPPVLTSIVRHTLRVSPRQEVLGDSGPNVIASGWERAPPLAEKFCKRLVVHASTWLGVRV